MKNKRICTLVICFMMIIAMILPTQVMAAQSINPQAAASLSITLAPENEPAKNVEFWLYRVAKISENGQYTYVGNYADYPIENAKDDAETLRLLASTLPGYIVADEIAPDYKSQTNEEGIVSFSGLSTGLYLVMGGTYRAGDQYITPTSFLISLPDLDTENVWQYDVEVKTKHYGRPEDETVNLDVLKIWKDDENDARPTQVEVELYDGFELYDTVILNKENDWKYTWNALYSGGMWIVREKGAAEGYTVSVEQQGNSFVITNTLPSQPKPEDPKLPQTGTLWWVVPILLVAGLMLVLVGLIRRRGAANGK